MVLVYRVINEAREKNKLTNIIIIFAVVRKRVIPYFDNSGPARVSVTPAYTPTHLSCNTVDYFIATHPAATFTFATSSRHSDNGRQYQCGARKPCPKER